MRPFSTRHARILFVCLLLPCVGAMQLSVEPSFILVDEDFPVGKPLPVSICPASARILDGDPSKMFILEPNGSCALLTLRVPLEADDVDGGGSRWHSHSLLIGGPAKTRANLDIQVVDVNDHVPQLVDPPDHIDIPQGAQVGSTLATLLIVDPDSGINGLPRLSVPHPLTVKRHSCEDGRCKADLILNGTVEGEKTVVEVVIKDGDPAGRENTLTHNITLRQHKNQVAAPPVFASSRPFHVSSKSKINSIAFTLKTKDHKEDVEFEMQEDSHLHMNKKGEVRLKKPIEKKEEKKLWVTARRGSLVSNTTIRVVLEKESVVEGSSVSPMNSSMVIRVKEESVTEHPLLEGDGAGWSLSLEGLPSTLAVLLDGNSLRVGRIDREYIPHGNISFLVKAKKGTEQTTATVTLVVEDVNDNSPIFSQTNYTFSVPSQAEVGTFVGRVLADDADASSPFNIVSYTVRDTRFRVDDTGKIFLKGVLKNSTHLRIFASDGGSPPRTSSALAEIRILEPVHVDVPSDVKRLSSWKGAAGGHFELVRSSADDGRDVSDWFEINGDTGEISVKKELDAKEVHLYIVRKTERDDEPVELLLRVKEGLAFREEKYLGMISSDTAVGETIVQIHVDNGPAHLSLRVLVGPSNAISITHTGDIVYSEKVQYTGWLNGTVEATEDNLSDHPRTVSAPFAIRVLAHNIHGPSFVPFKWTVLRANAEVGSLLPLPYPLATDPDSDDVIVYSIDDKSGMFVVDGGRIRTAKKVDQEEYKFTLTAKNSKIPSNADEIDVTVIVERKDVEASVREDVPVGTIVTLLELPKGLSLVSSDDNFSLDDNTLIVGRPLIGKGGQKIRGDILLSDRRVLSYSVSVLPPSRPFSIRFPAYNSTHFFNENAIYEELLRIQVEDGNDVKFKPLHEKDEEWKWMSVSEWGSVRSLRPFDREIRGFFTVRVLACGLECTPVSFHISVHDANDHCPFFDQPELHVSVPENVSLLPRKVSRIPDAKDEDSTPEQREVCYASDSNLFFFPQPTVPELVTNTSFDREIQAEYVVKVTAYDCSLSCEEQGRPSNGSLLVTVHIEDVNDNFPHFPSRVHHASVIGGASAGTHLTRVTATDEDEERDGLRYWIRGSVRTPTESMAAEKSPIAVNATTGEILAARALTAPSYSFTVAVNDSAGHDDEVNVVISSISHLQQTDIVLHSPFSVVVQHQNVIQELLSVASSLTVVVDRCRQTSNSTALLVHFIRNNKIIDVQEALRLLYHSSSPALTELYTTWGMEDLRGILVTTGSSYEGVIVISVGVVFLLVLLVAFLYCRSRRIHTREVCMPPMPFTPQSKIRNAYWTDFAPALATKPEPLQSTEL